MKWLNEPREWKAEGGNLSLVTEDKTDFWQATYYGWRNDNGHFYYSDARSVICVLLLHLILSLKLSFSRLRRKQEKGKTC